MASALYWKHLLVRTPLEGCAKRIRRLFKGLKVLRHPGLREVYLEDRRIELAMRRLIGPASNCIDVGAHIGSTLTSILQLAPRGRHLAFEPLPEKASWLRYKFPEVEVKEMALGDTSARVSFIQNLSRPGFSGPRPAADSCDRVREIMVDCELLDKVVGPNRPVDFLKIDVEGAELLVLRGAAELLRQSRPAILFESTPGGAEKFGVTREQLFSFLVEEQGYAIFLLKDFLCGGQSIDLTAFEHSHLYPFAGFNYLALKQK